MRQIWLEFTGNRRRYTRHMRWKRSRGEWTLSPGYWWDCPRLAGCFHPSIRLEYIETSGNQVMRYRTTSSSTMFPQLPHVGQTRAAATTTTLQVCSSSTQFQTRSKSDLVERFRRWPAGVSEDCQFANVDAYSTLRSMLVKSRKGGTKTEAQLVREQKDP